MNELLLGITAAFGFTALLGVLYRMKSGFGPQNIRAIGIVLVATFAALLAQSDTGGLTAAMGILGAIAGYIFGIQDGPKPDG
ncbi:MAG: hypothetical protein MI919_22135 [Holophagales bacterium]|nr:hypothetical protein [Holophagales bacterium]